MGSLDCFRNVLKMNMACPRQIQGISPAWIAEPRAVRRIPPVLGVSLRTKNAARGKMLECAECSGFELRNFRQIPSQAASIGFPTWNSPKVEFNSRWPGAWHSNSQKIVPCVKMFKLSQT